MTQLLIDGDAGAPQFLFAHGAGGGMKTPFMTAVARGIASKGFRVVRFEFPYMAERRKVPDREPVLLDAWRDVVAQCGSGAKVAIGGKSLGGRMASMVADELGVRALVCFGYPFHPPGRPERLRTAHLAALRTPALILQGTRDPFGTNDEVPGYTLSKAIRIAWIEGGDHSFRKSDQIDQAIEAASTFLARRML
jgi:predicted alpha/beta-hydrolase family hydrolase